MVTRNYHSPAPEDSGTSDFKDTRRPVAVLCGASSGLGYAIARVMAREGYQLVIGSRTPEAAAEQLRQETGGSIIAVAGDLAEPDTANALLAAAERCGGLDALLLNHGGPPVKTFVETTDDEWENAFRLMVQGPIRLLRKAVPLFQRCGGGRVVAVTSFSARSPLAGNLLSNSLRAALANALKTAAQELGSEGILLNSMAPGYIRTDRVVSFQEAHAEREGIPVAQVDARTIASIPLQRYGTPEEVAEFAGFLLSRRNGYVTGQHLLIDGGLVSAV